MSTFILSDALITISVIQHVNMWQEKEEWNRAERFGKLESTDSHEQTNKDAVQTKLNVIVCVTQRTGRIIIYYYHRFSCLTRNVFTKNTLASNRCLKTLILLPKSDYDAINNTIFVCSFLY